MIWRKKRIKDLQVYKLKKKNEFLIAYGKPFLTNTAEINIFTGVLDGAKPSYDQFCHSSGSLDWLNENCYPVSERKLKSFEDWYKFFDNYIMNF